MVMNGFNTNFDAEGNQVYAINTVAFHYVNEPIEVERAEPVRIYLVNLLEFDPINSFHIHANFFNHFPTGTSLTPIEFTDTVMQGQAQRAVLELRVPLRRRLHVPRPQDRVRRARLDGLLPRRRRPGPPPAPRRFPRSGQDRGVESMMEAAGRAERPGPASRAPTWALVAVPLALIAAAIAGFAAPRRPRPRRATRPPGRGARGRADRPPAGRDRAHGPEHRPRPGPGLAGRGQRLLRRLHRRPGWRGRAPRRSRR